MFVERLKLSYLEKLDLYTDEEVVVDEARKTKKNRVEVLTYLVTKDDKKEMIYKPVSYTHLTLPTNREV